jgi:hypothetical protein
MSWVWMKGGRSVGKLFSKRAVSGIGIAIRISGARLLDHRFYHGMKQ